MILALAFDLVLIVSQLVGVVAVLLGHGEPWYLAVFLGTIVTTLIYMADL